MQCYILGPQYIKVTFLTMKKYAGSFWIFLIEQDFKGCFQGQASL